MDRSDHVVNQRRESVSRLCVHWVCSYANETPIVLRIHLCNVPILGDAQALCACIHATYKKPLHEAFLTPYFTFDNKFSSISSGIFWHIFAKDCTRFGAFVVPMINCSTHACGCIQDMVIDSVFLSFHSQCKRRSDDIDVIWKLLRNMGGR